MGYKPTTSLGEQVGRYYKNAGGLDKAVDAAQEAQENRDPKVLDGLLWPKWGRGQMSMQVPVEVGSRDDEWKDSNGLHWLHPDNSHSIWLNKDGTHKQSTLEHEASHAAYLPTYDALDSQIKASADSQAWPRPHRGDDGYVGSSMQNFRHYLTDPAEVDVRLAEVKRRYAHHTGNLVQTPEEARKAWDWWRSYSRNLDRPMNEGSKSPFERPDEEPTMSREQFDFYDDLPPQMKQQMLHRMPELVDRGNAIRTLKAQMG